MKPLLGKRVLVTRARGQADRTIALLQDAGAEPVWAPMIEIGPPDDPAPLRAAVAALAAGAYGWVAFTSENGVERTWEAVVASGGGVHTFDGVRLAGVGPTTTGALARHGLTAHVQATEYKGEGLAAAILSLSQGKAQAPRERKLLLSRAAKGREVLPEALRAAGWEVDVVAAYQTRAPDPGTLESVVRDLEDGRIDVVTFTSSSAVDHLCDALEALGAEPARLLGRTFVASIGPATTATAQKRGVRVDATAQAHTLAGLMEAVERGLPGG